ncbi:MarR family transcriptional regulator [Enterobacter cloacae complex sp. ESBL7]|uniref:MarR family transcriptional regulator n=1 Tax=Enterobacter cloacae complex sp. ESBL7 TaxID=3163325 RepID=UPI0035678F7F
MAAKTNTETTTLEFIRTNPGMTSGDIARAMGRSVCSVSGQLRQMLAAGRVTQSKNSGGNATWYFNEMPFGCSSNPAIVMFNQLLKECRHAARCGATT